MKKWYNFKNLNLDLIKIWSISKLRKIVSVSVLVLVMTIGEKERENFGLKAEVKKLKDEILLLKKEHKVPEIKSSEKLAQKDDDDDDDENEGGEKKPEKRNRGHRGERNSKVKVDREEPVDVGPGELLEDA